MTMSTAEAHALSLQANGLLAELTRWQREHKNDTDVRLADAVTGLTTATRALQHLALGEPYKVVPVSDTTPVHLLPADNG